MSENVRPNFIKLADAAKRYDVTIRFLHYWIKKGKLRAFKLGKTIRISEDELDRFIQSQIPAESSTIVPVQLKFSEIEVTNGYAETDQYIAREIQQDCLGGAVGTPEPTRE